MKLLTVHFPEEQSGEADWSEYQTGSDSIWHIHSCSIRGVSVMSKKKKTINGKLFDPGYEICNKAYFLYMLLIYLANR